MDTSQQYIEMCAKAQEIQSLWEPLGGDFFFSPQSRVRIIPEDIKTKGYLDGLTGSAQSCFWLPRQDQLVELTDLTGYECIYNNTEIGGQNKFQIGSWDNDGAFYPNDSKLDDYSDTIEKALLKNLMFTKFNKTWNGDDWI